MALKTILVYVDTHPACTERLQYAARLAAEHGAHVTGLHVRALPYMPIFVRARFGPEIVEAHRRFSEEVAVAAEELFRDIYPQGEMEWKDVTGDLVETVRRHVRWYDLAVLGQIDRINKDEAIDWLAPDRIILGGGRPVLVHPHDGEFPVIGKRVLVAWDGSREATRAVHDAMPILQKAESVHVISFFPDAAKAEEGLEPGEDLCAHLALHGVPAVCDATVAEDSGITQLMLSRVAAENADLVVMGGYGHSRLRETVLGGATREMLRDMTVPVLMSH